MSSHIHIAAVGTASPLGDFLHRLDTAFGRWWNDVHDAYGPVFAERPSSGVIRDEASLARLIAYIHNNPCRAGLVDCPSLSSWTSHRAMIGLDPCPTFLDDEWTLASIGYSTSLAGRMAFHELVSSRTLMPRDPHFSNRAPSNAEVHGFVASMSRVWGIAPGDLSRPRSAFQSDARLVLVATAIAELGATGEQLARALGLSTSVLSRLRKKARGMEDPNLIEAYLFENCG